VTVMTGVAARRALDVFKKEKNKKGLCFVSARSAMQWTAPHNTRPSVKTRRHALFPSSVPVPVEIRRCLFLGSVGNANESIFGQVSELDSNRKAPLYVRASVRGSGGHGRARPQ